MVILSANVCQGLPLQGLQWIIFAQKTSQIHLVLRFNLCIRNQMLKVTNIELRREKGELRVTDNNATYGCKTSTNSEPRSGRVFNPR